MEPNVAVIPLDSPVIVSDAVNVPLDLASRTFTVPVVLALLVLAKLTNFAEAPDVLPRTVSSSV